MKRLIKLIAFFFIVIIFSGIALSDEKNYRLLDIMSFLEIESVRNPTISPDGKQVIFTRESVDKMNDRNRGNLWIVDTPIGRVRELSSGNWRDMSPVWSPNGKKVAFLSDRDGTIQIYVMWTDTKETARLTNLERAPSNMTWSHDGKMLAFTLFIPDTKPILPVRNLPKPKGAKWAKPPVIVDRLVWKRDGTGFLPKGHSHIFIVDAQLGGTPRKITSGDYSHSDPQWSADDQTIYFSAIRKPDAEYLFRDTEIYAIDIRTETIRALTDRKGTDQNARVSPDGKWIVYSGYDDRGLRGNIASLYIMDRKGENKRLLASELNNSPSSITWMPDSSGILYLLREKGVSNLYCVSIEGKIERITEGNHYISAFSLSKNNQVAAALSNLTRPDFLILFDLSDPNERRELVDVNKDVLADKVLGEVEEMWFETPDGVASQGWLMKPAEFIPGEKYPLVLWIHGGPFAMYSVRFNWAWQYFAACGYAVLWTNPRGSAGYGQDFINGIQDSYPNEGNFSDLMAGVDAALSKGFIDEENLFVTGASGGGTLTSWIVGHTDRFRAAAAQRPVTNWLSFVGTTDIAFRYQWYDKFPWEDPLEYHLESPLHYAGNVTTPTMLITGEEDLRTPMSQSEEFYRALKIQKKETLLVRIPDEFHGFKSVSHRIFNLLYIKAWFEKYRVKK